MAFYIYEKTKTIVEAETKREAQKMLGISFVESQNYINKATGEDLKCYACRLI